MLFAIFAISAISFATEECNNGSFEVQAPVGSCTNKGYVCQMSTNQKGGVLFRLGKTANCKNFETTKFVVYPEKSEKELDKAQPITVPMLYMEEDPLENVGALAVATNTAFIINARNEKIKVCVTYHRAYAAQNDNQYNAYSVRLQSITECD